MKQISFLFILLAVLAMPGLSQNDSNNDPEIKTLFGNKPRSNGGYIGLGIGYTQLDGQDAFTTTFRGGWIINHGFVLGLSGTGFSNDFYLNHNPGTEYSSLQGGYGGLLFQPILFPEFPVHVSFPITLGAGGVAALHSHYYEAFDASYYLEDESFFLLAEPGVELELNIIKFIRASFGVSYRFTTPLNLMDYQDDDMMGLTGSFTLSFGKF